MVTDLVDSDQGFQDIGLQAYKNSAGYPILKAHAVPSQGNGRG